MVRDCPKPDLAPAACYHTLMPPVNTQPPPCHHHCCSLHTTLIVLILTILISYTILETAQYLAYYHVLWDCLMVTNESPIRRRGHQCCNLVLQWILRHTSSNRKLFYLYWQLREVHCKLGSMESACITVTPLPACNFACIPHTVGCHQATAGACRQAPICNKVNRKHGCAGDLYTTQASRCHCPVQLFITSTIWSLFIHQSGQGL